jgi:hypothetical protein
MREILRGCNASPDSSPDGKTQEKKAVVRPQVLKSTVLREKLVGPSRRFSNFSAVRRYFRTSAFSGLGPELDRMARP